MANIKKLIAVSLLTIFNSAQAAPTNEEIMEMMHELKKELAELRKENQKLKGEVEEVSIATDEAIKSKILLTNKSTFGGYGEMHGNWLDDQKGSADKDEVDFHRFVLFFNHEFSDRLRFVSELELEHSIAGDGQNGEIELEQAYIEYDLTKNTSVLGGLFLLPLGLLNETHEPNTFYGVERNNVESYIIPSTWWEGGTMLSTNLTEGVNLKLAAHTALEASDSTYSPKTARQKGSQAPAEQFAYTAALKYTAIPGLTIGAGLNYQTDFQNSGSYSSDEAILYEIHTDFSRGPIGLRALYAEWDIEGIGPKLVGADKQYGWFIEPSYKVFNDQLGIFARYSMWDNSAGNNDNADTEYTQTNIGFNWWIDPQVVVKLDYQSQSVGTAIVKELNGLNLGLGYSF